MQTFEAEFELPPLKPGSNTELRDQQTGEDRESDDDDPGHDYHGVHRAPREEADEGNGDDSAEPHASLPAGAAVAANDIARKARPSLILAVR
jgi:hypothetical protein